MGNFVNFNKAQFNEQNRREEHRSGNQTKELSTTIQVKVEPDDYDYDDEENEEVPPPDFVNVKIESMDDDQSDAE